MKLAPHTTILLYWQSDDGQSDLYGGEHAADVDRYPEERAFLAELLDQCRTDVDDDRAGILAGRMVWVTS